MFQVVWVVIWRSNETSGDKTNAFWEYKELDLTN